MCKTIYWHIGLAKTGTTTLQKYIFPMLLNVNYLGRHYSDAVNANISDKFIKSNLHDSLIWKNWSKKDDFDNSDFNLNFEWLGQFGFTLDEEKDFLISHEGITSTTLSPQIKGKLAKFARLSANLEQITSQTIRADLKPKIILVLRRQDDFLEALFAQNYFLYKRFGFRNIDQFLDYIIEDPDEQGLKMNLNYFEICKFCKSLVGEENFKVLPFELLKSDPSKYLKELGLFMDEDMSDMVDFLTKKENTRSFSKGKLLNETPFSEKLKKKMGLKNLNFYGAGKKINSLVQRKKYTSLSQIQRKMLMTVLIDSNLSLIEKYPVFDGFNYDFADV